MTMARKTKQPVEKNRMIARQIIEAYKPKTAEDMNNALKDVFGPMIEEMLKAELDYHLGYENNSKSEKETANRRNGYSQKTVKTEQEKLQSVFLAIATEALNPRLSESGNLIFLR